MERVVSDPIMQYYETTDKDIERSNVETKLIELIKEFTKDPNNVQPRYQTIIDFNTNSGEGIEARKLEILFGMKLSSPLRKFVDAHNKKEAGKKDKDFFITVETILRVAKSCGEYPKITQLMIESSLRQMQTATEEAEMFASI